MHRQPPRPGANIHPILLLLGLLLLGLLAGDWYILQHPAELAVARAAQRQANREPVLTPRQRLAARMVMVHQQRADARRRQQSAPAAGQSAAEPACAQAGDRVVSRGGAGGGIGSAGQGFTGKLLVKAGRFYETAGIYLRGLLLLLAIGLVFGQPAPQRKPGGRAWRKSLRPQAVRIVAASCAGLSVLSTYVLLSMPMYGPGFIRTGYPVAAALVLASGFVVGLLRALTKDPDFGLSVERRKIATPDGFNLPTEGGGWVNVPNPYRGVLVLGGAGAGKTYSIGEPVIEQLAAKNFAGLIYDFKFPVLAEAAQKALELAGRRAGPPRLLPSGEPEPAVVLHVINFRDLTRSERVNPLRAQDLPVVAFAEEYARAIINNLNPASIRKMEFFDISAVAYLTGIIWFYKKHFPRYCTIPHVVATAIHKDFKHVLSMLETDPECAGMVRSIVTAVEQRAEKQVAAVVGTLQVILNRIHSPEIVWVLTPDEEKGEGFSLNLNDPKQPALLCIGNDPTLKETFSPVVSCIITVAIKLMNQQHKHRSYVLLDEAATVYVPGLELLPATARSNKVATIYMTQDLAQMSDAYGPDKMKVMVSNLNNQFFGKVNSLDTAKFISELVGREDKPMHSTSTGKSQGGAGSHGSHSASLSTSYQERNLVRVQDVIGLQQGEFIGQTVETGRTFFQGVISRADATPERFPLHPVATFGTAEEDSVAVLSQVVWENYRRVHQQVQETLALHVNTLNGGTGNEGHLP
ncbi:type IV secretory system conjugative DNA transfer family protein [Hymenobacter metallicola]|uniref:Type IV secretory system conjugative DNA transfer family protein n=1 Tax=Hymenobacter metallicola TaxID=2563114 RepID=A0A4Z0PTG2_9BACT|nr:type IV secretory system conjugative DNA transfer family protein [Hymenobacter metallicola]TGE21008.1 type IV secretory system conjugative DNA transfer family protein [Hymenobacter metallicola]